MSTRSIIAVQTGDTWKGRYCHGNGNPGWQARKLIELVRRDGLDKVGEVLTEKHAGWSYINPDQPDITGVSPNREARWASPEQAAAEVKAAAGRFGNVPGYGICYTTRKIKGERQIEPDDWRTPESKEDDWDINWVYVLTDKALLVLYPGETYELVGRVGYDTELTDEQVRVIECGEGYERCSHMAWWHFPEAKESDSRLGARAWLGLDPPGHHDITELIDERTGQHFALSGSGCMGYARDPNAWRDRSIDWKRPRYWWASAKGSSKDIRVFRILKAGYRLEGYSGVVVTSAGPQVIPAGTVLR